jgi:hypothetical protein
MPVFTITRQYLLPVYQHLVIDASTLEAACEQAIERKDWEGAEHDYDNARPITIEVIAEGDWLSPHDAPAKKLLPVPDRFNPEQQNADCTI